MDANPFALTEERAAALRRLVATLRQDDSWLIPLRESLFAGMPKEVLPADDAEWAASMRESFERLEQAADLRDMTAYLAEQRDRIRAMAAVDVPLRTIAQATSDTRDPIAGHLRNVIADIDEQREAVDALDFLIRQSLISAGEVYAQGREEQVEDEFRGIVRRLSTPVIQVWDEVQVLPLIGTIDSDRARQMTERLLERIVDQHARVVIIDITGVPAVDTAVADHILKTAKAAGLVGTRAILVGISPQVAQTLVRLGVSLDEIETYSDLRTGLEHALRWLGYSVERRTV